MISSTQVQAESIWLDKNEVLRVLTEHAKGATWDGIRLLDSVAVDINNLDEFHLGVYKVVKQRANN